MVEYHAFENEKKERGLICNAIDYGQAPMPPEIPSIEKKMEYFQSDSVRQLFRSVLDKLGKQNVEVKPIHGLWVSFWYLGKRFMYAAPKRNFFVVDVLKPDGTWSGRMRVATRKEWDQQFQKFIETYMQYLNRAK